ncbi:MAG: hypothetical protein JSV51_00470 [Candidatus Bathyarchaeota archaeon]|nr:MAG: hypothetical protein JSV51_00470 [Candidatus Bathyarchaeota archaeon]
MFEIKCNDCGKAATVPFQPTKGRPAYCRTCFPKHRTQNDVRFKFARPKAWVRY